MSEALLRPLLPRYGLAEDAPLTRLHRSENETWKAGDAGKAGEAGSLILRLHRIGYHTRAEIASELAWLKALEQVKGLRCVRPRPDRDGILLQAREGRLVVGFSRIEGTEPDWQDELSESFRSLGAITAKLHRHARGWALPGGFIRKRWDDRTLLGPEAHWGDWRKVAGLSASDRILLERLVHELRHGLKTLGTGPERFGLIHADLRLANLLRDGDRLWVIDFDDCGFSWWMFDFAAAVSFMEDDPRIPNLAACWLEGYGRIIAPDRRDVACLPLMVMIRRLQLTAWLSTRAESDTAGQYGGPAFARGTVAMAERFLARGCHGFWEG